MYVRAELINGEVIELNNAKRVDNLCFLDEVGATIQIYKRHLAYIKTSSSDYIWVSKITTRGHYDSRYAHPDTLQTYLDNGYEQA